MSLSGVFSNSSWSEKVRVIETVTCPWMMIGSKQVSTQLKEVKMTEILCFLEIGHVEMLSQLQGFLNV